MGDTLLTAVVLVASFGYIVTSDSVVLKPIEKKIERLTCYKCLDYQPHCLSSNNQTERVICALGENFCAVKRLDFQEELRTLKRQCSSSCEPGCEKAGDYMRCTSCCNSTLCNIDNAAISAHLSMMATMSSITVILYTYLIGLDKFGFW